ncbi:MAG TPA: hypothetical protein VL096_00815 [Pirellulaceae bacterium]|nr:hypothetical protein [Pirellulaceae bacterium]
MKTSWLWLILLLALTALLFGDDDEAACDDGQCSAIHAPLQLSAAELPSAVTLAPAVDIPPALRTPNWGGGSCVHASTMHLLHWQGHHELAEWWRATYSGGEYSTRLHERLDAAQLKFAYTIDGDPAFLEWALRTRRGAGITYFPNHAVNLVHLDAERAGLLDNNRLDHVIWIPRDEFMTRWQAYGGWAWTLVYNPPPPVPFLNQE